MDSTAINRIAQLAIDANGMENVETDRPFIVLDGRLKDVEEFMDRRFNYRASFSTSDLDSFVTYLTKNAGSEKTPIYIDVETMRALCMLDAGTSIDPGRCEHNAKLGLEITADFSTAKVNNDEAMSQEEMIDFIIDNRHMLNFKTDIEDGINIDKVIGGLRSFDVKKTETAKINIDNLDQSRSDFERIDATANINIPSEMSFRLVTYNGLPERVIRSRFKTFIRKRGEKMVPEFKYSIIGMDRETEADAEAFVSLIRASGLDINYYQFYIGKVLF